MLTDPRMITGGRRLSCWCRCVVQKGAGRRRTTGWAINAKLTPAQAPQHITWGVNSNGSALVQPTHVQTWRHRDTRLSTARMPRVACSRRPRHEDSSKVFTYHWVWRWCLQSCCCP